MSRKWMILLMASVFPLKETHRFFSLKYDKGYFPLNPNYVTAPAWHVHFIVTKFFLGMIFWVWHKREIRRDRYFARFIGIFALYHTLDFLLYLLNASQAGVAYFICVYLTLFVYAIYITTKKS